MIFATAATTIRLLPVLVALSTPLSASARLITGRQLLQAASILDENGIPVWYPGRPTGICTSRGHTCASLMTNKPYHVLAPGRCESARSKTLRDRFGRPLTIRYTYNKITYVANREQVCSVKGHQCASNRTRISENIDDFIWKNLSIWAREFEHLWEAPPQKEQYVKCHKLFASFHCSSMFPNCTAEYMDKKPALPCRELCEEMVKDCTWGSAFFFLPFTPQCDQYPSKYDHYKKCSQVGVNSNYIKRVAAAPPSANFAAAAFASLAIVLLTVGFDH